MFKLAEKLFQEQIEHIAKAHGRELVKASMAAGEDENALAQRILKGVLNPTGPIMTLAKSIPGLSSSPHLIGVGLSYLLEKSTFLDTILPDTIPAARGAKFVLKYGGGSLIQGLSEATTSEIETRVKERVNGMLSSSGRLAGDPKGKMDVVVVVPGFYGMRPFFPVKMGADGQVVITNGMPEVLDREFSSFSERWAKFNPPKRVTTGGARGEPKKTEEIFPSQPWKLYSFQDWLTMVDKTDEIGQETIDALKKEFAPPKDWDSALSSQTWDVIRAYIKTIHRLRVSGQRDWLDREDSESLVRKMLKHQPSPLRVNETIGKMFVNQIGGDGYLPAEIVGQIETAMDLFLEADQSLASKGIRVARGVRHSAQAQGVGGIRMFFAGVGLTSVVWLPVIVGIVLLVVAVAMFVSGLFMPSSSFSVLGYSVSGSMVASLLMFLAGLLATLSTFFFVVLEMSAGAVQKVIPAITPAWVRHWRKRIAGFTLSIFTIISITAFLGIDSNWRFLIFLTVVLLVGVNILLDEAGRGYKIADKVEHSANILSKIAVAVAVFAVVAGLLVSHPAQRKVITDGLDSAWSSLHIKKAVPPAGSSPAFVTTQSPAVPPSSKMMTTQEMCRQNKYSWTLCHKRGYK